MRDFSLDFFSRNVQLSQKEELFINKYKNTYKNRPNDRNFKFEALGLLTYLQMLLFSDEETGFYYDVSDNRFQLLANKLDLTNKQLSQTLDWCFEYSILDKVLYQKYKILTSYKMQKDYSRVLDRPITQVRAQNINMDYVYQCEFTQKYENALQKYKNVVQKRENVPQKTGEETRPDSTFSTNREKTASDSFSLDSFKKQFPTKKCKSDLSVPENVNLELLAKKTKESEFLTTSNNLDIEWLIKHYDNIISGDYKDFKSSKSNTEPAQNFKGRDYSDKNLNTLYDDLEKIEL